MKSICEYFLLETDLTSLCLAFVYSAMFAEEQKVCPLALMPNFHCKHLQQAASRSVKQIRSQSSQELNFHSKRSAPLHWRYARSIFLVTALPCRSDRTKLETNTTSDKC